MRRRVAPPPEPESAEYPLNLYFFQDVVFSPGLSVPDPPSRAIIRTIVPNVTSFLSRYAIFLVFALLNVVLISVAARKQRRIRKALAELAASFGWTGIRTHAFGAMSVTGTWNGRAVDFRWRAPYKNAPAYLSISNAVERPGRFEMRARGKGSFLNRPIQLFSPPKIDFFDPSDAERYEAWATDRTAMDLMLAIPGIRGRLDVNLADGGVLSQKKGRLRIRRALRLPRSMGFTLTFKSTPDLDRILAMAAEEWELVKSVG